MGWEQRLGRSYFYRKVRRGGRVGSEYCGGSGRGQLAAEQLKQERIERKRKQDYEKQQRIQAKETENQLRREAETVRAIVRQFLIRAGFRDHRGTWRLRRQRYGHRPSSA